MSVLWVLPLVVVAVGGFFLARAVARTADEARGLSDDVAGMDDLVDSLATLRSGLEADHPRQSLDR
jgi:hypothetical protein